MVQSETTTAAAQQLQSVLVPKTLPEVLCKQTTAIRNAISVLLVLKSLNNSGIHDTYMSVKNGCEPVVKLNAPETMECVRICQQSYKSIGNHINRLVDMGLLQHDEYGHLRAASYDDICRYFGLLHSGPGRLRIKITNKKLSDVLYIIPIEQVKNDCKKAFKFYVNSIPGLKDDMQRVTGERMFSTEAVWRCQLQANINRGIGYTEEENITLLSYRADNEVSYNYLTEMYGYSSRGSVAYIKRKIRQKGLGRVEVREFILDKRLYAKKKTRFSIYGSVYYDSKQRAVKLRVCDMIHIANWNENAPQTLLKQEKNETKPIAAA